MYNIVHMLLEGFVLSLRSQAFLKTEDEDSSGWLHFLQKCRYLGDSL